MLRQMLSMKSSWCPGPSPRTWHPEKSCWSSSSIQGAQDILSRHFDRWSWLWVVIWPSAQKATWGQLASGLPGNPGQEKKITLRLKCTHQPEFLGISYVLFFCRGPMWTISPLTTSGHAILTVGNSGFTQYSWERCFTSHNPKVSTGRHHHSLQW